MSNGENDGDTTDGDQIWTRQEIESPCVRVCVIHEGAGLCVGCRRSRAEIAGWSRMTPEARREIIAALPERASKFGQRRGGRANRVRSSNF